MRLPSVSIWILLLPLLFPPLPEDPDAMRVTSAAFAHQEDIPIRHTCYGANVAPPLLVENAPPGTASLALIMADPDALVHPMAPLGLINVTHWLIWNVPLQGGAARFQEGVVPAGAVQGTAAGRVGYAGPCPPVPLDAHRYHFRFFALDSTLTLASGSNRAALEDAMEGHVLAEQTLVGTFARPVPFAPPLPVG